MAIIRGEGALPRSVYAFVSSLRYRPLSAFRMHPQLGGVGEAADTTKALAITGTLNFCISICSISFVCSVVCIRRPVCVCLLGDAAAFKAHATHYPGERRRGSFQFPPCPSALACAPAQLAAPHLRRSSFTSNITVESRLGFFTTLSRAFWLMAFIGTGSKPWLGERAKRKRPSRGLAPEVRSAATSCRSARALLRTWVAKIALLWWYDDAANLAFFHTHHALLEPR